MAKIIAMHGETGPDSEAEFMDKRQLRQSAVADFMQSLEHLDELLGDTTEKVELDDSLRATETESPQTLPSKTSAKRPETPQTRRLVD